MSAVVGNVATLGFALAGFGAWALILGTLIAGPLRALLLFAFASTFYGPSFRFGGTKRLFKFGGNVLLTRIVWYWTSQADILIAGKLLGKEALGFYSVAVHLASLPMQRTSGMINGVAFAAFAKIQHDPRRGRTQHAARRAADGVRHVPGAVGHRARSRRSWSSSRSARPGTRRSCR